MLLLPEDPRIRDDDILSLLRKGVSHVCTKKEPSTKKPGTTKK